MNTQTKRILRGLLVFVPALYLVTSLITHCAGGSGGGVVELCSNTVTTADQTTCQNYSESNQCASFDFSGTTCTVTDCQVCTCSGTVTASSASACGSYATQFACASSSYNNGVCTVTGCETCENTIDDADFVVDVDDAAFDDF